jgi:DNA-binding beta-propeller fold protein YncE
MQARTLLAAAALGLIGSATLHAQVAGLAGTLVVTNKSPFTATIIDVASGKAPATLPTGRGPHAVALSSDGRVAVVTDYGSGATPTFTVIDVPGKRVARIISLGQYRAPHGIVFLPGDSIVAVTSEATSHLVLVHVGEGVVRKAIGTGNTGSHMVGVTANGMTGFTGNMGTASVSQLDLAKGTLVRVYPVPPRPEAINDDAGRPVSLPVAEQGVARRGDRCADATGGRIYPERRDTGRRGVQRTRAAAISDRPVWATKSAAAHRAAALPYPGC